MGLLKTLLGKTQPKDKGQKDITVKTYYPRTSNQKAKYEIPKGQRKIKVFGFVYSKVAIKPTEDMLVTLTAYKPDQFNGSWYDPGTVNINKLGTAKTVQSNWIGYVHSTRAHELNDLLKRYKRVDAHIRIYKDGDSLSIDLMAP